MKSDFMVALKQLAAERHLPMEQVLGAIEVALASAFKKDNPASGQNISVTLNPNSGEVSVYALKTVVDFVEDPEREITVTDASKIKKGATLGDEIAAAEPLPHNASRIAAQTAKQVVLQRLREAERELLFQEFAQHEGDIMSGIVETSDPGRAITLDLGRAQAILPQDEQVNSERYRKGQRVKVFVLSVRSAPKGPEILVSRSHRNMLRRLFEIEVPEVYNGVVEIKAIAREAGFRSKVAVSANQPGIDPVGSCIGIRGNRIQSIVNELQGEKIDIVSWDSDPKSFIANSLSPSEPVQVELLVAEQTAVVVVPDRQLSLAIGKEGQNTRLAARLTGWRLDIKGMTEWEEIREARLHAAAQAAAEAAARAAALAEQGAEEQEAELVAAVAEAEAIVEEAAAEAPVAVVEAASTEMAEVMEPVATEPIAEAVVSEVDEDSVLEALIREEENQVQQQQDEEATQQTAGASVGLSVDDLDSFTLDEISVVDVDDEEEDDDLEEEPPLEITEMPVLTPDAGKIRFAEDIVEDIRGGGRRGGGRSRRGGGGSRRR
jgi:N utilization substance protein A